MGVQGYSRIDHVNHWIDFYHCCFHDYCCLIAFCIDQTGDRMVFQSLLVLSTMQHSGRDQEFLVLNLNLSVYKQQHLIFRIQLQGHLRITVCVSPAFPPKDEGRIKSKNQNKQEKENPSRNLSLLYSQVTECTIRSIAIRLVQVYVDNLSKERGMTF